MADDPVVWFPPPEPIPQGPVAPQAAAPQSAAPGELPQPPSGPPMVGPPVPPPAPPLLVTPRPPMAKRTRTGLIVGGSILGFLLVVGAFVGVGALVLSLLPPPPPVIAEPVAGGTASPVAQTPAQCPDLCFTGAAMTDMRLDDDAFADIGLTRPLEDLIEEYYPSVLGAFNSTKDYWSEDGGGPDTCFFTYYDVPMAVPMDGDPQPAGDSFALLGSYQDGAGNSILLQTARLLETSDPAVAHMAELQGQIDGCPAYSTAYTDDIVLTAAPALDLPASVAAIGWVESSEGSRYYTFDLQRANLVIRSTLFTDGTVTEADFRSLVGQMASTLAALEPRPVEEAPAAEVCDSPCLSVEQAGGLVPTAADLGILGTLAADPGNAALAPTPTLPLWNDATLAYRDGGGDPAVCFFAPASAPLGREAPDLFDEDTSSVPLGTFTGSGATLVEAARVYETELVAGRYLGSIRSPIIQCAAYSYNDGTALREVTLAPLAFDTGSDDVTSAGWVETWGDQRRLVANLRYANVTMRVALQQGPSAAVTDEQFAAYVAAVATRMQAAG